MRFKPLLTAKIGSLMWAFDTKSLCPLQSGDVTELIYIPSSRGDSNIGLLEWDFNHYSQLKFVHLCEHSTQNLCALFKLVMLLILIGDVTWPQLYRSAWHDLLFPPYAEGYQPQRVGWGVTYQLVNYLISVLNGWNICDRYM